MAAAARFKVGDGIVVRKDGNAYAQFQTAQVLGVDESLIDGKFKEYMYRVRTMDGDTSVPDGWIAYGVKLPELWSELAELKVGIKAQLEKFSQMDKIIDRALANKPSTAALVASASSVADDIKTLPIVTRDATITPPPAVCRSRSFSQARQVLTCDVARA